jgi:UDP-3-O-[3-hydroxymyristoyl] glucosamine N-acyltransferase
MLGVKDIISYLEFKGYIFNITGNKNIEISGYCSLSDVKPNCITWAKKAEKLDDKTLNILDSHIIVTEFTEKDILQNKSVCFIECRFPKAIFFDIVEHFFTRKKERTISSSSIIETNKIGNNVSIGCFCHIGPDVSIGNNVTIHDHVVIECPTTIAGGTEIYSGVVIGSDGFGYYKGIDGIQHQVPHTGGVIIGRDVSIGANTCIDRGTIDDTIIGDRVKIDNLCHIAHNVIIEDDAMVIALSLLGGSSSVGREAYKR